MKQRLIAFAIIALLMLAALSVSEHRAPNAGLPLVKADYQRCITVNPGPLRPPSPHLSGDNRIKEIV